MSDAAGLRGPLYCRPGRPGAYLNPRNRAGPRDHLGGARQQRGDLPVVGPVPWPAVQEQHRWTVTCPVVGEPESVDRSDLAHAAEIRPGKTRFDARATGDHGDQPGRTPSTPARPARPDRGEAPCRDAWHSVTSADGTNIGRPTAGTGPGLLPGHGGMGRLERWEPLWGLLTDTGRSRPWTAVAGAPAATLNRMTSARSTTMWPRSPPSLADRDSEPGQRVRAQLWRALLAGGGGPGRPHAAYCAVRAPGSQ